MVSQCLEQLGGQGDDLETAFAPALSWVHKAWTVGTRVSHPCALALCQLG
jgi:hypothetical protein